MSDDVRNAAYEALARATHTVVADFGRRLDDLTATVRSDAEIRRDLVPPKSVAAAGRRLTGAQRRAVRDAIDEVITSQQADIERSLGSDTTEAPPEERLPMTPDLVAMVIEDLLGDGDPTGRLEAVLVDLMERYPAGREYVGQYIVWRVGIGAPNAVTSAAYQGAVSEFESLLGALLRLVAVVEPARIGGHRFDEDAHQADPKAYIHDLIWHYADAVGDAVSGMRMLSHLPVLAGTVLAVLVWRAARRPSDPPAAATPVLADVVPPEDSTPARRRGHLRPAG